jgi:hypothetical protein
MVNTGTNLTLAAIEGPGRDARKPIRGTPASAFLNVMEPIHVNVVIRVSDAPDSYFLDVPLQDRRLKFDRGFHRIVWHLSADPAITQPYGFDRPGITFFGENAPCLVIPSEQGVAGPVDPGTPPLKDWEVLWANVTASHQKAYFYRIRALVGDIPVQHDPTVENQPPLQP